MYLKRIGFLIVLALLNQSSSRADSALSEIVQSVPEQTSIGDASTPYAGDVWLKMVQGAKSSIDLGQMYLNNLDAKGNVNQLEPVLQALEEAGKRGVKIRLIISQQMKDTDTKTLDRIKKIKNAQVRIYDLGKLTGGIIHAKFWIVDRREVFVGSQNVDWKALTQIHELGIHLVDAEVARKLTEIFELDWSTIATGKLPSKPTMPSACKTPLKTTDVVASPPVLNPKDVCDSISVLISLIENAKRQLSIQVMDYSLSDSKGKWTEIDGALRAAAKRGVKIRLMVSHWNTTKPDIDRLKDLSLVPGIELKIVTIPELTTGHLSYARVIHSKYMIVDDGIFWLGTSNWSKGYFYNTRGVEIVVQKPEFATQGMGIFEKVWTQPYSEFIDVNRDYPAPKKD